MVSIGLVATVLAVAITRLQGSQISRSRLDLVFRIFIGAVVLFTVVMITLAVAKASY